MYLSYSPEKIFFTYKADDEDNYFRVFYQNRVPEECDINNSFFWKELVKGRFSALIKSSVNFLF